MLASLYFTQELMNYSLGYCEHLSADFKQRCSEERIEFIYRSLTYIDIPNFIFQSLFEKFKVSLKEKYVFGKWWNWKWFSPKKWISWLCKEQTETMTWSLLGVLMSHTYASHTRMNRDGGTWGRCLGLPATWLCLQKVDGVEAAAFAAATLGNHLQHWVQPWD